MGKELTVEITSRCNARCWWCSSEAGIDGEHVPCAEIMERIEPFIDVCDTVRISGGEPTLHPDLVPLVNRCVAKFDHVVILTNGKILVENIPRSVEFHVSFVNAVSEYTIKVLVKKGYRVTVTSVLTHDANVDRALNLAHELGIPCHLYHLQPQGRARGSDDLVTVTGTSGCSRASKVAITHDGRVMACSSEKEGLNCRICKQ